MGDDAELLGDRGLKHLRRLARVAADMGVYGAIDLETCFSLAEGFQDWQADGLSDEGVAAMMIKSSTALVIDPYPLCGVLEQACILAWRP